MSLEQPLPVPDPNDVVLLQQVQQYWNQGSQQPAIELVRPRADEGQGWAAALLAWLLMQQGYPALDESINWALAAAQRGLPGQLTSTFNSVLANLPSYPQLSNRLPELVQLGLPWNNGVDPVGQGWNLVQSGQAELGLQIMMLPISTPYPLVEPQLSILVNHSRDRANELDEMAHAARRTQNTVEETAALAHVAIDKARDDLETSAKQAGLLVTAATSDATNALFKKDAQRNAKESWAAWLAGLVVLGIAAIVAVFPVILHYLKIGTTYSSFEQIALHLVSTAALATFAGVLLARARSRDQAAQRANDLSTAMGTMIAYSSQISDAAERQRFMTSMGQIVLQAHLTSGSKAAGNEDSVAGMVALASVLRPATTPSAASSS